MSGHVLGSSITRPSKSRQASYFSIASRDIEEEQGDELDELEAVNDGFDENDFDDDDDGKDLGEIPIRGLERTLDKIGFG